MSRLRIATVVGARPQFIKAAAVSSSIERHNSSDAGVTIDQVVIHSGQHYDYEMSEVFFKELGLPEPGHHLAVGSVPHGVQTGEMLIRLEPVLADDPPDFVLTYGDTNTTLAAALAAAKLNLKIAHVEAGLRCGRREMPEEINRLVTDHLSSLLFCPSQTAVRNLEFEGIEQGVHMVGDVMKDVFTDHLAAVLGKEALLSGLGLKPLGYALATVHRAANTDRPGPLRQIASALSRLVEQGLAVVFLVHPRTQRALRDFGIACEGVRLVQPASYEQSLELQMNAKVVLTDSGGVQKEAYWLKVPCVTLRDETEWVETVDSGWNRLVDLEQGAIADAALLAERPADHPPLYGDGRAADKMVKVLVEDFETHADPIENRSVGGIDSPAAVGPGRKAGSAGR